MKKFLTCCLMFIVLGCWGCNDDNSSVNDNKDPVSQDDPGTQDNPTQTGEDNQKELQVSRYYCDTVYQADRTAQTLNTTYNISDEDLVDYLIEALRNYCVELLANMQFCKSETLTYAECEMNIADTDREAINTALKACSQQFVDCCGYQDINVSCQETVCGEERIACEDKASPCAKANLEYITCSQSHQDELISANTMTLQEFIEEMKKKYEAEHE